MLSEKLINKLQSLVDQSQRIVFFGGAGVSTESGLPDFRSVDGIYSQKYDYPPETMLSHQFSVQEPEKFFEFYRDKLLFPAARPNAAHKKLAELEAAGRLTAVITQNIDGLHQMAGSQNVLELHGSVRRNFCERCAKSYNVEQIMATSKVPHCDCGGRIKPDVVLYGEGLDSGVMDSAVTSLQQADMLIIGGTSLVVYPAAGLVKYYRGNRLVLINKQPGPMDDQADLFIQAPIGEVMSKITVTRPASARS